MTSTVDSPRTEDAVLRKSLGFWSLVATGIGSVIGSGWLFSAMYAAQGAGPAALIAWVIGGLVMLAVALVFAELGRVRPESGGLVRYPLYSNGRLAAGIVGWSMWVTYVGNPPTEASGVIQYASSYLPGVYNGTKLTHWGILLAIVLMALFVLLNYFGVALFAHSNNIVTAVKIFIPTGTVVLLVLSGFDTSNISAHGGFAPYGYSAALSTIATAGMVFAYTGFRNIIELSGEAARPKRDIPAALITTIMFTIILYLGLQVAFLGAVPGADLAKSGWHGVNYDSPFAHLAMIAGMTYLYWILIADSMVSPSGSGIVYTAANARNVFGLAKNGFFPKQLAHVNRRTAVPTRALLLNFVVGLAFLLPLPSWHAIIGVTGTLAAFTFSIGSVSLFTWRRVGLGDHTSRLPGMYVIAPFAFIVSSLVVFWVDWPTLKKTIPIVAVGLIWYAVTYVRNKDSPRELAGGVWLIAYLIAMYIMSYIGSYGGKDLIHTPWDSIVVAVIALGIYFWGVASGVRYMTSGNPEQTKELMADYADYEGTLAAGDAGAAPSAER